MDIIILAIVFFGSNLSGMYFNIPFTNINPTRTFLERGIGSLQLTSAVFAAQELHPLVFPEVQQERDTFWIKGHYSDIVRHAVDDYIAARSNISVVSPTSPDPTAATVTSASTASIDHDEKLGPHVIGIDIRKHLHPNLNSHNGIVNAVWEALAFALLAFTILCIIWKEGTKSRETGPQTSSGDLSMPMLVQALLQDRLSSSKDNGQQHDSVSSDELTALLNRTTPNSPKEIALIKTSLGDISERLGRIEKPESSGTMIRLLEAICEKLSAAGTSANDLIPQGTTSSVIEGINEFGKVLCSVNSHFHNLLSLENRPESINSSSINIQTQLLEEANSRQTNIERDIMQLKSSFEQIRTDLLPVTDTSTNDKIQSLEENLASLGTTIQGSLNEKATLESLGQIREKQEALEQRLDELRRSDSNHNSIASEQDLGRQFQRMDDRITSIKQTLEEREKIDNALQAAAQGKESDASATIDAFDSAVQNLQAANEDLKNRLENAESRVSNSQSEIDALSSRIYNPDNKYRPSGSSKEINLEELTRLFKNSRDMAKEDIITLKEKTSDMGDITARLGRAERTMRSNKYHLDKCMGKIGVPYEFLAGDDYSNQPTSTGAQGSSSGVQEPSTRVQAPSVNDHRAAQQKQNQQESSTSNAGLEPAPADNPQSVPARDNATADDNGTPKTPMNSNANKQISGWNAFAQVAQSKEKIETEMRRAEEDRLHAEGKLQTPEFLLKETFIQGDPKDEDDDHNKWEKTEYKIGSSNANAPGIHQSMWATSSSPPPTPTPAPTKTSDLDSSKLAETPSFVPTEDKMQQSSNDKEKAPSKTGSGSGNQSPSGLQSSRYAPSSSNNDKKEPSTKAHSPGGLRDSRWAKPNNSGKEFSGNKRGKSPHSRGGKGSRRASPSQRK